MILTRKQEEQLWRDLYKMDVNNNKADCENAYATFKIGNQSIISDEQLHNGNLENIVFFIVVYGITMDKIIEHCPLAKNFAEEVEKELDNQRKTGIEWIQST